MKLFKIPLINKHLILYIGKEEWETFVKSVKRHKGVIHDKTCPSKECGRAWGSWVWVYDPCNTNTVFHELSHFIDDVMDNVNSECGEFRAFITAFVFEMVYNYLNKKYIK